mmetsp:Transcript_41752/g.67731  ORF Transcript_41752/g.67731 Transcript_41752/m.67731 type:complete len:177 (-) Transcript_41752:285-815(-)|eukprot:CAMPEP_0184655780 /NCGR_PEP_ID=MMETSP0308-20130426/14416_1 /TAXON_ID=38269 /ORGANISM="Gloeochaete witrockiana, Strain SAG 46.84" /LENGTH=176 /DNA_ID=CAMNT_0027092515 /DNA_START=88 /DNA_END=618 /DNA_ORIENTATION=-
MATELNYETLESVIGDNEKHVLVNFYANWCHYSQQFQRIYDAFAKTVTSPDVIIAEIDMADGRSSGAPESAKEIMEEYRIGGFPQVHLFPGDSANQDKEFIPFRDPRTVENLREFLSENTGIPLNVLRTDDSSLVSLATEEDCYSDYYDTFVDECHEDIASDAATCSLTDFCGELP